MPKKLNKDWQKAADEARQLAGDDPAGQAAAVEGLQRMYDAIEGAPDEAGRVQAALRAFAGNTIALADGVAQTGTSADEAIKMAEDLLKHTLKHIRTIAHSVKHGHKKD